MEFFAFILLFAGVACFFKPAPTTDVDQEVIFTSKRNDATVEDFSHINADDYEISSLGEDDDFVVNRMFTAVPTVKSKK